jgi:3-oxoacyl-[acyl-carrier-protein] synthase-3
VQRTGIQERRRASGDENLHSMGIAAVQSLMTKEGASLVGVDLIIAASYTPIDTIGTLAHVIQRRFELRGARALYLSTACSSFMDAIDAAAAYFESGRAHKALIVAAEHNSAFARDEDEMSGHLWGDGAAAVLLDTRSQGAEFEVVDVYARGLAECGQGPLAITLNPRAGGLVMHHGREVFARACQEIAGATREVLARNGLGIDDVRLFIPHQANKRIIDKVAQNLGLPPQRVAVTITDLGNTGCASVAITLHRHGNEVAPGDYIVLATFGGGYSVGAALLRRTGGH